MLRNRPVSLRPIRASPVFVNSWTSQMGPQLHEKNILTISPSRCFLRNAPAMQLFAVKYIKKQIGKYGQQ